MNGRARLCWSLLGWLCCAVPAAAQHPWPVEPLDQSHEITGAFAEYRDTAPAPHFHDGVDIPKPDRSPVYAVADGRVTGIGPDWIRVDRYAYVHVRPAPNLSVGDLVFARQTVVGTILDGYGHVHFTDGFNTQERQPLREGGGLTPFVDPWAPVIENVRFYHQPTRQPLKTDELTGPVEITFRVRERTGPPGSAESRLNNGAYTVGYKVLTRDRQTEVYVPGPGGVRFRFDTKPPDANVHFVYDRLQSSTDSHVYIVTNTAGGAAAWDTSQLPEGDYTVMLFAGDTRGNEAVVYVDVTLRQRDILPPPQPVLLEALLETTLDGPAAAFAWAGGEAPDLGGYHLYRAPAPNGPWARWPAEAALDPATRTFATVAPDEAPSYFYLTAVDTAGTPNESVHSDVYGLAPDPHGRRLLVVDGFDRNTGSGSWLSSWHAFAAHHGRALAAAGAGFATAANEAVATGAVDLRAYDAVFWLLGDESTADETFSAAEQARVRAYLEAGGRLFVSGSEIAWDLGEKGSVADRAFLADYLKVRFVKDDAGNYTVRGTDEGIFAGLAFNYGSVPYQEDYPDHFEPAGGGVAALRYGNGLTAGVQYEGTFGAGATPGRVVVLGFPFETIAGPTAQTAVMARVLGFFFPAATHAETPAPRPTAPELAPAYPNPVGARTTLTFTLPHPAHVTLAAYDVLGRLVARLADGPYTAGTHRLDWTPTLGPGLYFVRLDAAGTRRTRAVTLLR